MLIRRGRANQLFTKVGLKLSKGNQINFKKVTLKNKVIFQNFVEIFH